MLAEARTVLRIFKEPLWTDNDQDSVGTFLIPTGCTTFLLELLPHWRRARMPLLRPEFYPTSTGSER
jgi:hypothetical protein